MNKATKFLQKQIEKNKKAIELLERWKSRPKPTNSISFNDLKKELERDDTNRKLFEEV